MLRLILVLLLANHGANAQEHPGHELFHQYYQYWYNQKGTHCCDNTHCRPAQFRFENGRWEVLLNNVWRTFDDSRYVKDDGGLGPFGTVCAMGDHIFCVDIPDALG